MGQQNEGVGVLAVLERKRPNQVGHIDWQTERVCVLAADYAASDLNGDASAYWYSPDARDMGLDPWALVEGVDPHTDGRSFDIWFANGACKQVGVDAVLYLAEKDAAALNAAEAP